MYRKLLIDMVRAYLGKKGELPRGERITDSMEAEPDNERVEIYLSSRRRSTTVLAITLVADNKILEIYPGFPSNIKASFSELFKYLGFTVMERKQSRSED